jgi:hypothetical protein
MLAFAMINASLVCCMLFCLRQSTFLLPNIKHCSFPFFAGLIGGLDDDDDDDDDEKEDADDDNGVRLRGIRVGSASVLVRFICVNYNLRKQISRSQCNLTL